jgi:hypothetical protein
MHTLKQTLVPFVAVLSLAACGIQTEESEPGGVPEGTMSSELATGTGLKAEYFDNADLTAKKLTRVDPTVNFYWGNGAPAAGIGADTFSVRWSGEVEARYSETYTFTTTSDDGVRLWVNGQLVVNNWTDHSWVENSGTLALTAGRRYALKMEYYDRSGGAAAKLAWSSARQPKQIVPTAYLYPTASAPADAGTPVVDAGTPDAGTPVDAGTPTTDAGTPLPPDAGAPDAGAPPAGSCLAQTLLSSLGKTKLLTGADMDDTAAGLAPYDLRAMYIAGSLFDSSAPCASCASGCTSQGLSCSNSAGCGWWGCWQWDQVAPGQYVRDFVAKAAAKNQLPYLTYYILLQASGATEGPGTVTATNDAAFMTRYFADFRFFLQAIGTSKAFVHLEPDFWGYAQQANSDPTKVPSAVASANPTDCSAQPNTLAGFSRCLISMVRKYAPNAKVGLHASAWATRWDVLMNTNPSFDVVGEAKKLGSYLVALGIGGADFVAVDASDRDAGYYESRGRDTWWDASNATLPSFKQAFTWSKAVSEATGKPHVWWQTPIGNMSLPNTAQRWKDNRVDYFMTHLGDLAKSHGFAVVFGAGQSDQTNPSTDGSNLMNRVKAYVQGGGQVPCPP